MQPTIRRISVNQAEVNVNGKTYLFSYNTCVGYKDASGTHVCQNIWSKTTGKHLNYWQPDHSKRITHSELENALKA
jgi:hypothetical protein